MSNFPIKEIIKTVGDYTGAKEISLVFFYENNEVSYRVYYKFMDSLRCVSRKINDVHFESMSIIEFKMMVIDDVKMDYDSIVEYHKDKQP